MTDPVEAAAKAAYESKSWGTLSWESSSRETKQSFRETVRAALPIFRAHHFREAAELIEAQTVVDATRDSESRRIFFWEAATFLRGLAGEPGKR